MLADVPMVFILVGIAAYTVLSGADFGAGLWTLVPGGGQAGPAAAGGHIPEHPDHGAVQFTRTVDSIPSGFP